MTDKLFSHIGVATYKNKTKFKWTMGKVDSRIKILEKNDFKNIEFHELPHPMTKAEALQTEVARDIAARHGLTIAAPPSDQGPSAPVQEAA